MCWRVDVLSHCSTYAVAKCWTHLNSLLSCCYIPPSPPLAALPHGEDLRHSDENVDEVQLETYALIDNVFPYEPSFTHSGVV